MLVGRIRIVSVVCSVDVGLHTTENVAEGVGVGGGVIVSVIEALRDSDRLPSCESVAVIESDADRGSVVEYVAMSDNVSVGSSLTVEDKEGSLVRESETEGLAERASVTEKVPVSENVTVPDGVIES